MLKQQTAFQNLLTGSLLSREAQILTLKNTSEFDVLIIGGGATGSGCALDVRSPEVSLGVMDVTQVEVSSFPPDVDTNVHPVLENHVTTAFLHFPFFVKQLLIF